MQMHKIADARSRYTYKSVVYLEETVLFTNSCFLTVLGKQRERERETLFLSHSLCVLYTHTKRERHTLSLSFSLCAVVAALHPQ